MASGCLYAGNVSDNGQSTSGGLWHPGLLADREGQHCEVSRFSSEQETEQLWLDEAERRVEEINEGKVKLISSEEFERRVQARLK